MYAVDGARRLPEHALDHLPGYEGSPPGPDRQRRGRPAPDRRARRGDDRPRARPRRAGAEPTTTPGRCSARWSTNLAKTLAASPTTACGRSAARCATSPTPGSWCGPPSTARSAPSRSTASPGPLEEWRRLRDAVRAEVLDAGLRRASATRFTQHYDTTEVDASLLVLPLDRLRRRRRPADARHHRGDRGGPDARRPGAALPHRDRRRRARRATSTRSWPARSGWSRRTPPPAAPTTRTRCSTGWSAWSTTSACSRRSTTPRSGRMVGNFPQAFSHLALVQAAFALAARRPAARDAEAPAP